MAFLYRCICTYISICARLSFDLTTFYQPTRRQTKKIHHSAKCKSCCFKKRSRFWGRILERWTTNSLVFVLLGGILTKKLRELTQTLREFVKLTRAWLIVFVVLSMRLLSRKILVNFYPYFYWQNTPFDKMVYIVGVVILYQLFCTP